MEEQKKDRFKCILAPNESVSIFKLGDQITEYLYLNYKFTSKLDLEFYLDTYDFADIPISIWTDEKTNSVIETIICDISCVWRNKELIGMPYSEFLTTFDLHTDKYNQDYSVGPRVNGRNYDVYNFDMLGLMVWVWRKKIRSILVSRYEEDEVI